MYHEPIANYPMAMDHLAGGNGGRMTMVETVDDSLVTLFRDEASITRLKEPLYGNSRLPYDALMHHTLCELVWFYDVSREEETPSWDPYSVEKMRQPVIGYSHYRAPPATLPLLTNFAWYHNGLLDSE